jgi:hypothetical protein
MGYRYTMRDLEGLVDRLNRTVGAEVKAHREATEAEKAAGFALVSNVGTYYLMGAYGGHKLVQITNYGGGVRDVLRVGYSSKRELYYATHAYLDGMEAAATDSHYSVAALRERAGTIEEEIRRSIERREKFRREDEARNAEAVKV